MLYTSKEGLNGIWQYNPESKPSIRIVDGLLPSDFGNCFWESNSLYFVFRTQESDLLLNVTDEDASKITKKFPAGTIYQSFGISAADSQTFLFTRNRIYDANIYSTNIKKQ